MKQTARIISTYTADVSGVCSALFELGGMSVIHDASGCNSTYNTHDEPRWYDYDSMVFLSGISEMEAIMGDDEKLIQDIISATEQLSPKFVAIAGTPIPMMIGTDFKAIASVIEKQTGIPAFGLATNGMHTYIQGVSMALEALAKKFVINPVEKTKNLSVNLLGVTPLDFSINNSVSHMREILENNQIQVISCWSMGDSLEQLQFAPSASINLVVSYAGLSVAKYLKSKFHMPYLIARPYGKKFTSEIIQEIKNFANTNQVKNPVLFQENRLHDSKIIVIGEGVSSCSLAKALELETGKAVKSVIATEFEQTMLAHDDSIARDESELIPVLKQAEIIIADPLYQPICPESAKFISLGHEGFSGRIYHDLMPDMTDNIDWILSQL
ncbi:MAG: oxidoreductase [Oscillospiraceae bacterium]|nr:oxidoreductase [Oscillospiraceae bacterium]